MYISNKGWEMRKSLKILTVFVFLFFTPFFCYAGTVSTSGVTAQVIIDRVRIDINESTAKFITDSNLVVWINEAVNDIIAETGCLESGVSNVIVIENVRSYSIENTRSGVSYLAIEKAEYDIGISGATTTKSQIYDLDRVPFQNLKYGHEKEFKGDPKCYAEWYNSLYIWPIPGSAQSGNTIYVYRSLVPSGVTSGTSVIELPSYFNDAIMNYAKAKCYYKLEKTRQGDYWMAQYLRNLKVRSINIMRRDVIKTNE